MPCIKSGFIVAVFWFFAAGAVRAGGAESVIVMAADNFSHIYFKRIKPNNFIFSDQQLTINVVGSASFLMNSFDSIRKISHVRFEWKSEGVPKVIDKIHEERRTGDDAVFKLGILLESSDAGLNPFMPQWMKRVEELLNFPSEKMIYLVAGSKHAAGARWENPYNKRVTMVAVSSNVVSTGEWRQARYRFDVPVNAVALWLMSDGDNTDSTFTAHIRNIVLN